MKLVKACIKRAVITALIGLSFVAIANAQSVVFSGDFSNMTVGTIRPFNAVANGGSWNFPDVISVGDCASSATGDCWTQADGLGFSLNSSGPFTYLLDVPLPLDYWGNGTTQTIYMKALTPTPAVRVIGCTSTVTCAGTSDFSISGTAPPPPNPNPPPAINAIGVGEITAYWLVTPSPVAEAWRGETIRFSVQPNDWIGVATSMGSSTWGGSIGVDMEIDAQGNGRSETFYVKGRKQTSSRAFTASSDNHFAVASQTHYMKVAQVTVAKWVEYEYAHPLSTNPNAGGGTRIFADKNSPNEPVASEAWRMVGIRMQITPAVAGMRVRLKVFDVDDPSSDVAPVDPNGAIGGDNRETSASYSGTLLTDGSGVATAVYRVSTRPGDNYRVAAAVSSQVLTNSQPLKQKFDAIGVDSGNGTLLKSYGYSNSPLPTYDPAVAFSTSVELVSTPLLTVWRRLFIESDSMGEVTRNYLTGSLSAVNYKRNQWEATLTLDPSVADLEPNRFEGGRLALKETAGSARIDYEIEENDARTITITQQIPVGFSFSLDSYTLYDDDDFDDFGPYVPGGLPYPNGDDHEDIPAADTGLIKDSDDPSINIFAPAYVRPKHNVAGNEDDLPFVSNTDGDTRHFDNLAHENNPDFWMIYLLHDYQSDLRNDCDPDPDPGGSCLVAQKLGTAGAVMWAESYTDYESFFTSQPGTTVPSFVTRKRTVGSMVGLLFDLSGDGGIMGHYSSCSPNCVQFTPASIAKIRNILNP